MNGHYCACGQWTTRYQCYRCEESEPQFEAYTFDESTGSERIHLFYTAEARDKFLQRQPSHVMAH